MARTRANAGALARWLLVAVLSLSAGAEFPPRSIFVLWNQNQKQWCGYSGGSAYTREVEEVHPYSQGSVSLSGGNITTVTFVQTAVSGDWT